MINCKDCVYWDRENVKNDTYDVYNFPDAHVCTRAKAMWMATDHVSKESEWPQDEGYEVARTDPTDLAFVQDGESYAAELITMADFGCVMGEINLTEKHGRPDAP